MMLFGMSLLFNMSFTVKLSLEKGLAKWKHKSLQRSAISFSHHTPVSGAEANYKISSHLLYPGRIPVWMYVPFQPISWIFNLFLTSRDSAYECLFLDEN